MKFSDVIEQASALLQRKHRLTYRSLKLEFDLDDEQLDVLKDELIDGQQVAKDEAGKVLVWVGNRSIISSPSSVVSPQPPAPSTQPPIAYTPAHLAERIRAATVTDGERKTITALFADLKGSTALIEGLDPEEARAVIDPALQLMMDAVHQYDGYVAQALGDGIFALFGAPIAHEDHPQRALYAALRMQEEMRRYGDQVRLKHGVPLALRVGVNTGEVVVRSIHKDDLHTDYVPVGHSTNLAARMEQMATPGSILITEYTRKLVEGYFELKALGAAEIKGVEVPLNVYEVLGAGPLRTRLQVATRRGLTRFVGRQSEMDQLQRALEHAKAGQGQIVGVMGEPGLGKSRLFYEFTLLSVSGCLVLEAYSVSHGKASAYLPVIELLKSYFDIQAPDDERKRREKVGGKVLMLDRTLEDTLPYLFALLGIEEQPSPLQQMDPQIRRRRTFEALKKLFARESLNQPLILTFEDLHWIDSETQGFLDVLSESVASAKILLLTNYRPEYRHEWGQKTYYTQLRLAPLGKAEAEEFLDVLLGNAGRTTGRSPFHALKSLILEKTEGTPFFMEEIVQELREQGVLPEGGATHASPLPTDLHIPPTVQGILAARIDRLAPDEKALLQQLSVIGREFPLSLMRHVVTQPEEELYRLLSSLQRKEFLYEQPAFPEVEYIFKHALTQEVAYNTVLHEQRKALHERTAQALEALYATSLAEHYSDLAHHYRRSAHSEKAITYLHLAGQQAVQRSANTEALTHLTAAVEHLKLLPDTPARGRQELAVELLLGKVLQLVKGIAAPEVERAYTRARELCQHHGEIPQRCSILFGLKWFYIGRGDCRTARAMAEEGLGLAQHVQDPLLLVEGYQGLGAVLVHIGEFTLAQAHLGQGLACYERHWSHSPAPHIANDARVACLRYMSWVLWFLGYPDQALAKSQAALAAAQELALRYNLASASNSAALLHRLRGEVAESYERATAAVSVSTQHGFAQMLAWGTGQQGWTLMEQGQGAERREQIHQGLAALEATGIQGFKPWWLGTLAEVDGNTGQTEAGLSAIVEGLELADKSGERYYEAELYRLKGTLTLQATIQDPKPEVAKEAEEYFWKAIEIARQQQAKSWELRATTSLARLWQSQGKQKDAHKLLSEIYHWFTEGFDTKDLQEAKALLEELT